MKAICVGESGGVAIRDVPLGAPHRMRSRRLLRFSRVRTISLSMESISRSTVASMHLMGNRTSSHSSHKDEIRTDESGRETTK